MEFMSTLTGNRKVCAEASAHLQVDLVACTACGEAPTATVSRMLGVPGLEHDSWSISTSPLETDSTGGFSPA